LEDRGSIPGTGNEGIVYLLALEPTQPLIQWVPGALSSGGKATGAEADHSSPFNAEVRNSWCCTSIPHTFSWRGAWLSIGYVLLWEELILKDISQIQP